MGKGDKKTAKGKRIMGSYGNSRKRKKANIEPVATPKKKAAKKATTKKVTEKKAVAKKATPKKEKETK